MISSSQKQILGVSLGKVWRPVFKNLRAGAFGLIGKSARPFPGPSRNLRGLAMSIENLPGEEWRPVVGYESLYSVSNMGRIKSHPKLRHVGNQWHTDPMKMAVCGTDRILADLKHSGGYIKVALVGTANVGTRERYRQEFVHRIVAKAFCTNSDVLKLGIVNHINSDRRDNRAVNLEWCTQKHNYDHARNSGSYVAANLSTARKGGQVDVVFRDGTVMRFQSQKEAKMHVHGTHKRKCQCMYRSTHDGSTHPWNSRSSFFFRRVEE